MMRWLSVLVAGITVLAFGNAKAALILDTGQPDPGSIQLTLASAGVSFQHLGVTFNVAQASSVQSLEGWISGGVGSVLFELHDGANPGGALLFSQLVNIADAAGGWRGASGLDWVLDAGDYTLALIAQAGFTGGMPTNPPNPAGVEWFDNPLSGGWTATTTFNMGWRVGAEPAAVPEPATLAILGLGLAGLGAIRRKYRQDAVPARAFL